MSRTFEPVHLPPEKHPKTISATLAAKESACPRSAYLYLLHEGGASSPEMVRGTAMHTAIERCIQTMLLEHESRVPGDVARDIAGEVLAEGVHLGRETDPLPGHVPVPFEEADYVRMCVFRWAEHFTARPDVIHGVEQMFALEVGDWKLRGKLDLAMVEDRVCSIIDWKSSRALPAYDEVSVVRSDGRPMPKQFALIAYALLARFGTPVFLQDGVWVELPRWPAYDRYELSLVYPGVEVDEGLAVRGPLVLEERDLHDFRRTLAGQVAGFSKRFESGDWPAVPGSHCSECPAPFDCPIPHSLRDFEGAIGSLEQAEDVAAGIYVAGKALQKAKTALRNAAKAEGWPVVRCGSDRGFSFKTRESADTDWTALKEASERGPVDLGAFRKKKASTEFSDRRLSPEEMDGAA